MQNKHYYTIYCKKISKNEFSTSVGGGTIPRMITKNSVSINIIIIFLNISFLYARL